MKTNLKTLKLLGTVLFISVLFSCKTILQKKQDLKYQSYLFTYFTGNGPDDEAIRYAISKDGYNYRALNNNQPIVDSKKISSSGGVRDPHILRGEDGKTFYMVVTDLFVSKQGWKNYAMILMKSTDLINWSSSIINIPETYPKEFGDVKRVWAPQTIYDKETKQYMIYWSMLGDKGRDIIYYAYANKDFTALATVPKQLYYSPTNSACIDGDIIFKDGKYHLFFKNEDNGKKGIMQAVSNSISSGYKEIPGFLNVTKKPVEGSSVFKMINSDDYILMYDMYMSGKYQFTKSKNLEHFTVVDDAISMDFHPRHGTVIPITKKEEQSLLKKWGNIDKNAFIGFNNEAVKKKNIAINDAMSTIYLPLKSNANLEELDPKFELLYGITVSPRGEQDFSKAPVNYTFTMGDKTKSYTVTVAKDNNPVLDGLYADPEIMYSNKDKKYYLYPTSDGFTGWSGTYFKTFSSKDLVNWKDEGVILDLKKDVSWANKNAWAPAAAEKKINGKYQYFYYFTAAQKIGVAVSDNPTGPFIDSGKPLIAKRPKGARGAQEIDPDVFTDPVSGKSYLYWGNGYMACAALNDDMVSIKENTVQLLNPDATYREGTEVFYRKGTYYFMWSENDTRSPNYRVRYATSNSPTGPLTIPKNNIVIEKRSEEGIYATGHNSVIQTPGTDNWHIVYHRFNRPNGINMGRAAGFNREVCIDKMKFNNDGSIIPVTPTLKGINKIN